MATGIADRKEYDLALVFRLLERFLVPAVPMHRVVSVQQQVRASLVDQRIGVFFLFVVRLTAGRFFILLFDALLSGRIPFRISSAGDRNG